jgi:alcohol dehydrogenase
MSTGQTQIADQPTHARPRDPLRPARYVLPTSIVYGKGTLHELPGLLSELGVSHPLIVTDRGLAATPIPQQVIDVLVEAGIKHELFAEVEPDPSTTVVDLIAQLLRERANDGVIGLGGGSAMDAAKAAAAAATSGLPVRQLTGPDKVPCDPLPIVAIPTTAGTGSEVTRFAVLTDVEAGAKISVASMRIMPKFALLDPSLSIGLPRALTASTGLDALAHAVESYGSVWNNPVSEGMALHAISLVGQHLRVAVANPGDLVARAGMLAASCIAELAANTTRLGLAHALAVPLGATHHVPHGVGVAMLLGPMCAYNEEVEPSRYSRVASALGASGGTMSADVNRLCTDIGLNSRLRDFGVRSEDYARVIALAMKSDNVLANPRPVGPEELRQLLERAQ